MAQCKVCNARKGKRICQYDKKAICSECCGKTRNEQLCQGCSFYSSPTRRYQDVAHYSSHDMQNNDDLQSIANTIESAICLFDINQGKTLNDLEAIKIFETLLDKYYFKDENLKFENELIKSGFLLVDEAIQKDLSKIDNTKLYKILGVLRFVSKRRTEGRREYINFVHEYVGIHLGTGIRLMDIKG